LDFEPFWPLLDTKVGGFLPLWTRFCDIYAHQAVN